MNKNLLVITLFTILGLYSTSSLAAFGWDYSSITKTNPNSNYYYRLPMPFIDDIVRDQDIDKVQLTTEQKHQALVWGLSDDQEKRYVLLMQNRSGNYFKDTKLSPIEVLGINARDDSERAMYAKVLAQMEFEKNAKILAFDTAFHNEAIALQEKLKLPIIRGGGASSTSKTAKTFQLQNGDKLMLFVERANNVDFIISPVISELKRNPTATLNVYFIDNGLKDSGIASWAKNQNIPIDLVNEKHSITLNLDKGQFNSVKIISKTTPLLILVRDGRSEVVDLNLFN